MDYERAWQGDVKEKLKVGRTPASDDVAWWPIDGNLRRWVSLKLLNQLLRLVTVPLVGLEPDLQLLDLLL